MPKQLPPNPSLSSLKYEAKQLLKRFKTGDTSVLPSLRRVSRWRALSDVDLLELPLKLSDAQHIVALEYGLPTWSALKQQLESPVESQFTVQQRQEFHCRGVLKLPGFIPQDEVNPVREKLFEVLERTGATKDNRWVLEKIMSHEGSKTQSQVQKRLKQSSKDLMETFHRDDVVETATSLAGKKLDNLKQPPQLLFTPPNADRWQLPSKVWHVDIPRLGEQSCPGIQLFSFVDDVVPEGGGTIVAAGSHRYVNSQGRVKSKDVKKALRKAHPWFRGLFSSKGADKATYMDQITRDGDVELQAVELTGSPGDVYLMDLRLFHTLAPNVTDRPRLMVTQRYYSERLVEVFH